MIENAFKSKGEKKKELKKQRQGDINTVGVRSILANPNMKTLITSMTQWRGGKPARPGVKSTI